MNTRKEASLLYIITLLFYLANLTYNFSAASDGITYLNEFESAQNLFQPHHLLYHLTTYGWFLLTKPVFPGVDNNYLIESVNAFWGAGALTVFYLIQKKRFLLSSQKAVLSTLLPAFSFGMWFYSTNIEVYIPPVFLLLSCLYVITDKNLTNKKVTLAISLHILSILFHQVNILMTPVLLITLYLRRKEVKFFQSVLKYAAYGIISVLGVYLLVGWVILGNNSTSSFLSWLEGYTNTPGYWYPLNIHTLINAGIGFSRAFIGAHFVFKMSLIELYIQKSFFYHNLNDEMYLVRNMPGYLADFLFALCLLAFSIIIYMLFSIVRKIKTFSKSLLSTTAPFLGALIVYIGFFIFWMPQIVDFWIPQTVFFWTILAGLWFNLTHLKEKTQINLIISLAGLLLITNYFGSIKWLKNISNDYYYAKVNEINQRSTKNDILLLQDGWLIKSYTHRYAKGRSILIPDQHDKRETDSVNNLLKTSLGKGNHIFLLNDKSYFHSVENFRFVDSLLQSPENKVDSVFTNLNRIKIIQQKNKP